MGDFVKQTKEEVFQALITGKDASPVLAAIMTSNSKASFYQSLFQLFADVSGDFQLTFEAFEEIIDAIFESKQVQTDTWWRKMALEFQLGDSLSTLPNGNLYYPVIDEDKQIVKRVAVRTSGSGLVTLLIAKLSGETPVPLSVAEKSAFNDYTNDRNPSGIVVSVFSVDGDEIKVEISATIDTQIINVADGTLLSDDITKPVEDAVYNYFATFQGDDFGGTFYTNNMLVEILNASGVINATIDVLTKKSANEPSFTDVLSLPGKSFGTFSGYVKIATGYDLSANISYSALV